MTWWKQGSTVPKTYFNSNYGSKIYFKPVLVKDLWFIQHQGIKDTQHCYTLGLWYVPCWDHCEYGLSQWETTLHYVTSPLIGWTHTRLITDMKYTHGSVVPCDLVTLWFHKGFMWIMYYYPRADSRLAPSQLETLLQSNAVSHWLGANLESALYSLAYLPWQGTIGWLRLCRSSNTDDYRQNRTKCIHNVKKNANHVHIFQDILTNIDIRFKEIFNGNNHWFIV